MVHDYHRFTITTTFGTILGIERTSLVSGAMLMPCYQVLRNGASSPIPSSPAERTSSTLRFFRIRIFGLPHAMFRTTHRSLSAMRRSRPWDATAYWRCWGMRISISLAPRHNTNDCWGSANTFCGHGNILRNKAVSQGKRSTSAQTEDLMSSSQMAVIDNCRLVEFSESSPQRDKVISALGWSDLLTLSYIIRLLLASKYSGLSTSASI